MKYYIAVLSLFREMQKLGIPINVFILDIVINSYYLMHRSDCVFSVLPIYLKGGILFIVVTFTTLIRGMFDENKVKDAVELFKKLVREKIYGLCKDGNPDAAINLLYEMKHKGIRQDILTYNSLIDGLCKLDVCTFNILTDGLCKEGNVEDAEEVMKNMVEKGVEPDIITYNAIMHGYCLRGQLDRARIIFDSLVDKGIETNSFSYNILINGYCKKRKLAEAMQLFCEISQKGSKPDIVTYNTILHGLFDKAKDIPGKMEDNGCSPNNVTYNVIVQGFLRCNKISEMASFMKEMAGRDFSFDVSTTMLLVDAIKENPSALDMIPGLHLLKKNVVINGLCKNGKLNEAHAVFEKLSFTGMLPIVRTYTVMINGFCLEGLFDEAKYILRKMEVRGCSPNNVTYSIIVQEFLRCNKISEMASFMKEMAGRGFSFDATTTELLINVIRVNPSVLDMIPELHSINKK
ncbi:pentatricopeptide repeat-containing protein At1g62670, mitochondrial-like [Solanum dulcamara]|uniref:pentatricopeptide repeat-containing protein At1g62670, mitochondrial-like n=1 Tax=Solanum dulcamara TaxID=45834 RepID=UPI002485BF5E|nr:pentatricopeptide repeat-containing protein At1g62670, mitochondrial-like [Solanum dulcamara]